MRSREPQEGWTSEAEQRPRYCGSHLTRAITLTRSLVLRFSPHISEQKGRLLAIYHCSHSLSVLFLIAPLPLYSLALGGKTDDCGFNLYFSPSPSHYGIPTGSLPDPGSILTWVVTTRDAWYFLWWIPLNDLNTCTLRYASDLLFLLYFGQMRANLFSSVKWDHDS